MMPAAVAALFALACFVILVGAFLARCSAPTPPVPLVTPHPDRITAESASLAAATASQTVKVTIHRKPASQDALQATKQGRPGGLSLDDTQGGSTIPTDGESITIEVSQAVGVAAGASASAFVGNDGGNVTDHARLGVIAATLPGVLALDYQLARLDLPPWLLGVPLELGLDAAVNLEAGAVGATVGSKAFAGAWAYSRWNLSDQGVAVGLGLRF
jgi:hypothetical protein